MASRPITPYQAPLLIEEGNNNEQQLLSSIKHVAIASKSYRIFGLDDVAWQTARDDLRRYTAAATGGGGHGSDNDGSNDGTENRNSSDEEQSDLLEICQAIYTALQIDAGGYGTAGFHLEKVQNVQQIKTYNNSAIFTATLHPHAPSPKSNDEDDTNNNNVEEAYVEQTPHTLITNHYSKNRRSELLGNDEFYASLFHDDGEGGDKIGDGNSGSSSSGGEGSSNSSSNGRFQLRIIISKANDGVSTKKFHDGLFNLLKESSADNNNESGRSSGGGGGGVDEGITIQEMINSDEQLMVLQQHALDARSANNDEMYNNSDGNEGQSLMGYYVTIMLCEPHVPNEEVVIPPPSFLDKLDGAFKAVPYSQSSQPARDGDNTATAGNGYHGGGNQDGGVFSPSNNDNICTSQQFVTPGPWEKANLKAFELIALDVKKALVRVEFPMFPEGCRDKTFREVYQLNARLKSGSFATVCRGTHRATGKKVAIKCVLRQDLPPNDDAAIYDEVLILSTLRHRYICPLIDFFEEVECYFLVMELMSGGDLFDRIGKRKTYTESDARNLCRKLLESVRYCHENSVAHCDVKPKNLLLKDDDDDVEIKLTDFGFATRVYEPRSLAKQCGTPFFVAPEVLMRSPYDQQSDMWSVGVIIYLLLGGDLPFMGRTQKQLFRSIVLGQYEFPEESWMDVSEEAKDLVRKLLVTDPSKRLTSHDAMNSSWMRQRGNLLARNNLLYTSQRLKTFNARQKLRASMLAVTAISRLKLSTSKLASASDRSMSSNASGESSQRSVEKPKKLPSFLDLPEEGEE